MSTSIAEVLFFILALICGAGTPLLPIQLLWLNIVTDGMQDVSLSLEKPEKNIMFEKPRSTKESLFSKSIVSESLTMGFFIGLVVFGAWMIFTQVMKLDLSVARSLVMALMVFLQNIHAFNCRSEKQSIFKISLKSNWFFLVSVLGSVGLQILFMEVPVLSQLLNLTTVPYDILLILLAASLTAFAVSEIYKVVVERLDKKKILLAKKQ